MTAGQLRGIATARGSLACSPVIFLDDHGREWVIAGHQCKGEFTTNAKQEEVLAEAPGLIIYLKPVEKSK